MHKKLTFFLGCLLLVLLPLTGCGGDEATEEPTVPLETCTLPGNVTASCGDLEVPEDRSGNNDRSENGRSLNGQSITIHFAVIPAESSLPEPDPIFLLAGGPGQAATEAFPPILGLLDNLSQNRDIVLVDQRGTGQSNPLTCDFPDDLDVEISEEESLALLESCRETLQAEADLDAYTTDTAMADLNDVRAALGYEEINLIGISYGTRAALSYLRLFPEQVRTVVLDAVTGPGLILYLQTPRDGQRALDLFFERCAADAQCSATFPDLETEFNALREQLVEGLPITITHPNSGETISFTLDQEEFMQIIFNLLYSTEIVSILPLLIHNANETGDFGPLITQSLLVGESSDLYTGMFYAVSCSEDAAYIDLDEAESLQAGSLFPLTADTYLSACATWPQIATDPIRQPVASDAPVLLLSGSADPVTPPQYAEQVAETLPNSRHLVVPNYGHGVLTVGCMPAVVARFVNAGTVADLNTDCLAEIVPPPFFINPAGPAP